MDKSESQNNKNVRTVEYIEFDVPCCGSIRECAVRKLVIVSLRGTGRILKEVSAVRCARGIRKKVKFYLTDDVTLIHYYVSNRGVHHIYVLWKPPAVSNEKVINEVMRALKLYTEEKINFDFHNTSID